MTLTYNPWPWHFDLWPWTCVLCSTCTLCPEKRDQNVFVISSTKLARFWWHLVPSFPNKFATKSCKHFPPHVTNVSTLHCETWKTYAHSAHATIALLDRAPEFITPQLLWSPNSPDLNPVDYRVWEYCKRRCEKYASLIWTNWNSDWERSGPSWNMLLVVTAAAIHQWRCR